MEEKNATFCVLDVICVRLFLLLNPSRDARRQDQMEPQRLFLPLHGAVTRHLSLQTIELAVTLRRRQNQQQQSRESDEKSAQIEWQLVCPGDVTQPTWKQKNAQQNNRSAKQATTHRREGVQPN